MPEPLTEKEELAQARAEKAKAVAIEKIVAERAAICMGAIPRNMLLQIAEAQYAADLKAAAEKPAEKAKQ